MVEPRTVNAFVVSSILTLGAKHSNIVLNSNIDNVSNKIYVSISQLNNGGASNACNEGLNPSGDANFLATVVLNRAIECNW